MTASVSRLYPSDGTHGSVVHAVGEAIVNGQYQPGTAIPTEERLAAEFGAGRSAIRESIRVLSGKGLVKAVVGRGTIVQPPSRWHLLDPDVLGWTYEGNRSPASMDDLTGLRLVLEPSAARMVAARSTARLIEPIEDALARMRDTVDDTEAFVRADLEFHAAIVAATENPLLMHLNSMMSVALEAQRRVHTTSKTRHRKTIPVHRKVLEAIRDHDGQTAEDRARDIIESAHQDILFYTGRAKRSGAAAHDE